jgi:hypothetical protein
MLLFSALRELRESVDGVLVAHRAIALGTDGPQVIHVRGATLGLGHVVAHLKIKGRHHVFTPRDEALVFKEPIATKSKPDLLSQSSGNPSLHSFILSTTFKL